MAGILHAWISLAPCGCVCIVSQQHQAILAHYVAMVLVARLVVRQPSMYLPVLCGATGDMQQLWLLELLGLWLPPGWHRRSASSSKHHYSHHELAAKAE